MSTLIKNKVLVYSLLGVLALLGLTIFAACFSYVILAILILLIYWTVFGVIEGDDFLLNHFNSHLKQSSLFLIICFGSSLWIVLSSVYFDKTIYVWDQANYWLITNEFDRNFFPNVITGLDKIYITIQNDDYNVFPTLPLLPWNKLVGNTFFQWTASVYLFSLLPAILVFILLFTSILKEEIKNNNWYLLLCFAWVFFFPQLFGPATRGYLDGFGLLFIGAVLYDLYKDDLEKCNFKKSILLGVLFVFLLFTRRWYAFWVVSYFLAVFISRVILFFLKGISINKLKNGTYQLIITGLTLVSILFVFFKEFLDRSIGGQYKDVLSAWKTLSDTQMFFETLRFFGPIFVGLSVLGLFVSLRNKKLNGFSLAISLITVFSYFLFTRVQSLGLHHNYLFIPFFLIFSFLGASYVLTLLKGKEQKSETPKILIIVSLLALGFCSVFTKTGNQKFNLVAKQFCAAEFTSNIRPDIERLKEITNNLNQLNPEGTENVYVLASSQEYNGQLFNNSNLPEKKSAINGLLSTHEVDRRDGFPVNFFRSKYVVVVDPIQLHLNPEEQTTIKYLSEQLLSGTGMGRSFELLSHTDMGTGATIKIYKKINEIDFNDIQIFSNVLKQRYPDMQYVYSFLNKDLMENIHATESNSYANFIDNNTVYVHPGDKEPVSFELNTMGNYSTLKFKIASPDSSAVIQNCGTRGGEINLSVFAEDSLIYNQYCTINAVQNCQLSIAGKKRLKIVVDKGKNGTDCDGFQLRDFEILP